MSLLQISSIVSFRRLTKQGLDQFHKNKMMSKSKIPLIMPRTILKYYSDWLYWASRMINLHVWAFQWLQNLIRSHLSDFNLSLTINMKQIWTIQRVLQKSCHQKVTNSSCQILKRSPKIVITLKLSHKIHKIWMSRLRWNLETK